jgi:MoxR-like ATPase
METTQLNTLLTQAREEIGKIIIGQQTVIDLALLAVVANQHALVEGVPGVAKTLLVRTLARVLGCEFERIQFTPDLMPADITGTNVFNLQRNEFTLVRGPIFTAFLLADEINRAPAKTQSALLQAMQERQVTIDRETHALSPNFTVFATQNPVEYEGTYPLPEAQVDRFMMKIVIGYPAAEEERRLYESYDADPDFATKTQAKIEPVFPIQSVAEVRAEIQKVRIEAPVLEYLQAIVQRTRDHSQLLLGCSPRAGIALLLCSKTTAAMRGRDFVIPDDIKENSWPALRHRLILKPEALVEGINAEQIIDSILQAVKVPR